MDFDFDDETALLQRTVRQFAREVVAPAAGELDRTHSFPYEIVAQMAELGWMGIPFPEEVGGAGGTSLQYAVAVMTLAGRSYWRQIGSAPDGVSARDVLRAIWKAVTLRYLRGGGNECYYPEDETPSAGRRRLHTVLVGGMALCLFSTGSAAVLQDFLGSDPPYPLLSAPVITGTLGGVGIVVGCLGLLVLKARSSGASSVRDMTIKDYGLLVALTFLALSGLATLLTRSTAAFGAVFLVHLAAILLTFALAPYSKLVHVVFRFLALVRDETEQIHPAASA